MSRRLPDLPSRRVGDSLTRRVGESPTRRLAESGSRFSITNISANSKPKAERLERYCKGSMRTQFLQNPRKSASLPCPFKCSRGYESFPCMHMAQPLPGSKLPIDYTSVIEVTKDNNTNHDNLLWIVSEHKVFSGQKPTVLCLCIQHQIAPAEVAIPLNKRKYYYGTVLSKKKSPSTMLINQPIFLTFTRQRWRSTTFSSIIHI